MTMMMMVMMMLMAMLTKRGGGVLRNSVYKCRTAKETHENQALSIKYTYTRHNTPCIDIHGYTSYTTNDKEETTIFHVGIQKYHIPHRTPTIFFL